MPWTRLLLPAVAVAAAGLVPTAASAELVVFTDGGVLRVEKAEARDQRMWLRLDGGAELVVPLLRVERVVDDEIVRAAAASADGSHGPVRFVEGALAPDTPYGDLIFEASRTHGMNPALVAAVVRAESAFDPRAVSPKGARGLMQLMPATARRFGLEGEAILEPERNVDAGVRYLRWLAERFDGSLPLILAGYNAGEGAVDRYGGVPPYRETQRYVRRVADYWTELSAR